MVKKMFLVVAAVVFATSAFAQSSEKLYRNEISVSYGAVPSTTWLDVYSDVLGVFFGGRGSSTDAWGAVTVGYNFRVSKLFSFGVQGVYASFHKEGQWLNVTTKSDNTFWTVMPSVKFNWINLPLVSFYSRGSVGATFCQSKVGGQTNNTTEVAFQVSPIGIEVGRRFAGYFEAGIASFCENPFLPTGEIVVWV